MPKSVCPTCGTEITRELAGGLCPRCSLAAGLSATVGLDAADVAGEAEPAGSTKDASDTETLDLPSSGSGSTGGDGQSNSLPDGLANSFGDYELIEEIARGAMGVIYKARQISLNRIVALKMILRGQFASESDVRRFYMEAESAANLDHPGIVPIYEIGEHDGHHFFSMKLVEGGSLSEHLPRLREDTRKVVGLIAEIAETVHHAHQRGILHRDLKPANILINEEGQPLVSDLGLAKQIQSDSDITGTGAIIGTPSYMPPEQAAADKEITTAADIYSIGAMLYEALTGRPPHQSDSPLKTLVQVMNDPVTPPREIDKRIDRTLELVCMKCLQQDPNKRYASAAALAGDLENWLDGRRVSARAPSIASAMSDVFYNNLRSAIGAAIIGALAGLLMGFGLMTLSIDNLFGRWKPFDLQEIHESLPSMAQYDVPFTNLPKPLIGWSFVLSPLILMYVGWVLQRMVRPKTTQQVIAMSLSAGLLMTLTFYGGSMGIVSIWGELETVTAEDVNLLAKGSLLTGDDRDEVVRGLLDKMPDLKSRPPSERAQLLAQRVNTDTLVRIPRLIWGGLFLSLFACLIPCVSGSLHAFRMEKRDRRVLNNVILYTEVMLIIVVLIFFLGKDTAIYFGFYRGPVIPRVFTPSLILQLMIIAAATVPGFRMWKWYWRWPVYPLAVGLVVLVAKYG